MPINPGGFEFPGLDTLGLEVDPSTGDLLILYSNLGFPQSNESYVVRLSATTGQFAHEITLPGPTFSGLARRWDGRVYTVGNQQELWLLDLESDT